MEGGGGMVSAGYNRVYDHDLRVKLNSAAFLAASNVINVLVASGAHPFNIITAVFRSCEIIFWHAILGRKDVVPLVPLVAVIAQTLRPHGPTWLGHVAMRAILPMLAHGATPRAALSLDLQWKELCAGNLAIDFETLVMQVEAHGHTANTTYDRIPEALRFTNVIRLHELARVVPLILDELGWPSPDGQSGTPADIFALVVDYAARAKNENFFVGTRKDEDWHDPRTGG